MNDRKPKVANETATQPTNGPARQGVMQNTRVPANKPTAQKTHDSIRGKRR